jgi:glycosyltransferase involved in cell wall biosynthesis
MLNVLRISSVHFYLTVPFVLSWSMMESMASECVILGSNTPPVMEVLEHERNGIVVDFYDHMNIADWVDKIFAHPTRMKHLGKVARQTIVDTYSLKKLLPLHLKLINDVASGKNPPPAAKEIAAMNPLPDYMFAKAKK